MMADNTYKRTRQAKMDEVSSSKNGSSVEVVRKKTRSRFPRPHHKSVGIIPNRQGEFSGTYTRTRRGKKEVVRKNNNIYMRMKTTSNSTRGVFRIGGGTEKNIYTKGRLSISKRTGEVRPQFKAKLTKGGGKFFARKALNGKVLKVAGAAGVKNKSSVDLIAD
jgi:hypothetical protein